MSRIWMVTALVLVASVTIRAEELHVDALVGPTTPEVELVDSTGRRFAAVDFTWPLAITGIEDEHVFLDTDPPVVIARHDVLPIQATAQLYHETIDRLARDPAAAGWFKLRGDCWRYGGFDQQAAADYLKAYRLRESSDRFALKAAEACWHAERYRDVVEVCDRTLARNSDLAMAEHWRGRALERLGDSQAAIAAFDRTIQLDCNQADAFTCRSWLKLRTRDYDGAIADARAAIELSEDPRHYVGACAGHLAKFDLASALACTREALAKDSQSESLLVLHLGLLYELNQEATLDPRFRDDPVIQEAGYLFRAARAVHENRFADALDECTSGILLQSRFYCPCDGSKTLAFRRNLQVLRLLESGDGKVPHEFA